jgi:hypothetical protein
VRSSSGYQGVQRGRFGFRATAFAALFLAARVRFNSLLDEGLVGYGMQKRSMTELVLGAPFMGSHTPPTGNSL